MDGILFNVFFNKIENSVRIVSDELNVKRIPGEYKMIGQTEGSANAQDMENILKAVNPGLKVELIGANERD